MLSITIDSFYCTFQFRITIKACWHLKFELLSSLFLRLRGFHLDYRYYVSRFLGKKSNTNNDSDALIIIINRMRLSTTNTVVWLLQDNNVISYWQSLSLSYLSSSSSIAMPLFSSSKKDSTKRSNSKREKDEAKMASVEEKYLMKELLGTWVIISYFDFIMEHVMTTETIQMV